MTKSKLIELFIKYQNREITSEDIVSLKELADEEIDIVLKSKNKTEIINLLKNENFRIIPQEIKEEIIKIINRLREGSIYIPYIIKASTNKNIVESNQVLEVVKIIIRSKGPYQADKITHIASNPNTIASGKVLELCKLIYRYERNIEQLNIAVFAATDTHIIRSGNVLNIVEEILSAKNKEDALKMYYEYMNQYKELTLLDSLSSGAMTEFSFWDFLLEDTEKAVNLISQTNIENEIDPNTKLNKEQLGYTKTRKK